ncbi:MAG: phosphohistidine phosphatase SixA [Gammaproteobacteria bacterium]|nr:phosphohistidine phosphatase SixA [Gammaproteobacteria bacterium]
MKLAILRHGTAEPWRNDETDEDRALTVTGVDEVTRQGLAHFLSLNPESIWVSPYRRTQQTVASFTPTDTYFETTRILVPESPPMVVLDALINVHTNLLLVSHQPLVSQLIAKLSARAPYDCPMNPASLAILEGDVFAAGCMQLEAIYHANGDVTR